MTASGQLRLPSCCGAVPAKSISISSPRDRDGGADRELALGPARARPRPRSGRRGSAAIAGAHDAAPSRRRARPSRRRRARGRGARRARRCAARPAGARRAGRGGRRGARPDCASARRARSSTSSSSRVGGMTTPSSASVRESAGMLPGSLPPTSAWWARVTAKPSVGARDERDVGEVRAAGEGVVEDRRRRRGRGRARATAATASGIAPRCTGMCSAWAIMRPPVVEERASSSRAAP